MLQWSCPERRRTVSNKSYAKDENGTTTHIRETSDDGRASKLYRDDKHVYVEVAERRKDGSTDAYVPDHSFLGQLLHGGKGRRK
jgi:hypothetical protein